MKLKPGDCFYPLVDVGKIEGAYLDEGIRVDPNSYRYPMMQVEPHEWMRMRGDLSKPALRGRPLYVAWFAHRGSIAVYPAPASECELIVHYFPSLRVA